MLSTEETPLDTRCASYLMRGFFAEVPVRRECRKPWNRSLCYCEELRVILNADASIADSTSGRDRRSAAHERIEDNPFTKRERGTDDLTHERLRLKRWMGRDFPLGGTCRSATDNVAERSLFSIPSESAGFPLAKIILNTALAWLSEEPPRLPTGPGHDRYPIKLLMSVLGTISAAESLNQANDFPSFLEPGLDHWNVDLVGKKRVRRDEYMPARHKDPKCLRRPASKEVSQLAFFVVVKNGKARQWLASASIERWRYPPYSAVAAPKFSRFFGSILLQSVRGIGDYRVNAVRLSVVQPCEAVPKNEITQSIVDRIASVRFRYDTGRYVPLLTGVRLSAKGVPEQSERLIGLFVKDSFNVSWQEASQDQERLAIDIPKTSDPFDHGYGRSCLAAFESGQIAFADPEAPCESDQRPISGNTLRSETFPKILPRRDMRVATHPVLLGLHMAKYIAVYLFSQPPS